MKNNSKETSKDKKSEAAKLPFEPASNRKKTSHSTVSGKPPETSPNKANSKTSNSKIANSDASNAIPEVVSKRMARRMAFFSGIPTGLGMLTFVVSYIVVSQHLYKLPTVAVLFVSLGFFGLGVLGLTYGVLSASWDEDRVGTWLGWTDFQANFGRTIASFKSAKSKN